MVDNLIFLHQHGFKLSYRIEIECLKNVDVFKHVMNLKKQNKNIYGKCQLMSNSKFNYNNQMYIIHVMFHRVICIDYVTSLELDEIISYVSNLLLLPFVSYKLTNHIHAISSLNLKNISLKEFDIENRSKNNVELDMSCETFINTKHGGLCFNGTLSEIVENYITLYSKLKLPIILTVLFNHSNSYFYLLPLELKNVILSFI